MKAFWGLILISVLSNQAYSFGLEGPFAWMGDMSHTKKVQELCLGAQVEDDGNILNCTLQKSYTDVIQAELGESTKPDRSLLKKFVDWEKEGVISSFDHELAYAEVFVVKNTQSEVIGYAVHLVYRSFEWRSHSILTSRYNLDGSLVQAKYRELD